MPLAALRFAAAFLAAALCTAPLAALAHGAAAVPTTVSGIPLDAPWKVTVYRFARTHFHHPAWGWQHSERDYRLAVDVARRAHLHVDTDVLFAAAMLHDMAGFAPWERRNVEHGDRAAVVSAPVLRAAGFPMAKYPAVAAAERGHMFYRHPTQPDAIALHDADSLDFLGDEGVTRILATVGEAAPSVNPAVATLRSFVHDIPAGLRTPAARAMAAPRVAEMTAFLNRLDRESDGLR